MTSPRPGLLARALTLGFALLASALAVGAHQAHARAVADAHVARAPHIHFACSGKHAAKLPCRFSTPSNNIHCQWLPSTGAVTCELLSSQHGYVLAPTGKARRVSRPHLPRRGETLPIAQQLVFPRGLSCHDTRTSITCNQNFAAGSFKLAAPRHAEGIPVR